MTSYMSNLSIAVFAVSRIAESIMLVLISIIVVIGFTFLVIVGALRLVTDLVAMSAHRQPSLPDELPGLPSIPMRLNEHMNRD